MIWLLLSVALGAELERYPWSATVPTDDCTACQAAQGAVRVAIPPLLRSASEPSDGTDLLLVDAQGEVIPVAWVRGQGQPSTEALLALPTEEPDVLHIEALDRPIQGLTVSLADQGSAATAQVYVERDGDWVPHGQATLVWRTTQGIQQDVAFPPAAGPFRLHLSHHLRVPEVLPQIRSYRLPSPSIPPVTLEVPVQSHTLHESGWVSYEVQLPHDLPIVAAEPLVQEGLFTRGANLQSREDALSEWSYPDQHTIQRSSIGGARIDEVRLPWPSSLVQRQVVLQVDSHDGPVLDIPALRLELEGLEAVVLDPPPGPWTLYGGAPSGTSPVHDLRVAAPELFRMAEQVLETQAVVDNPAYEPPELRAGLALPGSELDLRGYTFKRPLQGAPGLVSVPLPPQVLAEASPDLADLRLVDAQGMQIPYVLRQKVGDNTWTELEVIREEDENTSNIRVTVPSPEVPVAGITLHTEAPLFSRRVTLSRARGAQLEPLRAYDWQGKDRPTTLRLDVDAVVGETLLVQIHNGDDPPLPVDVLSLHWPAHELMAWLPEGGASLVYGKHGADSPDYDLHLMRDELQERDVAQATLGEAEELQARPPSIIDRIVLIAGLLVLVLGLLVLTLSLLRKVPKEEDEEEAAVAEE